MNRMISPLRYLIFVLTFSFSVVSESKDSIETVDFQNQVSVCNDPLTLQDQPAQQQVAEFFSGIFSTINWPARWYCGTWSPFHGWFSIFSDFVVWFSYFTIPAILYFFLHKRRVPKEFQKTFWLFIAFILCCGLTHLIEVIIFWWPAYRLNTMITFATASVSLFTVFSLVQILPSTMSYKSPEELQKIIKDRTHLLKKKTTELEQVNKELKTFAYVAAHDLKAPLTNIESLVNLLESGNLSDDKKPEVYERINKTILQSKNKIEALNDVLSVRSIPEQSPVETNVSEAVSNALDLFDESIKESNTKIVTNIDPHIVAPIPNVYLITIIQNLITNAIKYQKPDQEPIIHIICKQEAHQINISISDNGRGIDLGKFGDKLFGLFQRFQLDVVGKGVGLYITRSLLESFGGTISAESEVGKGSTFHISFLINKQ